MMTLERDPCSKIILAGIILVGIYHTLDTNVRFTRSGIIGQKEHWDTEITVRVNNTQDSYSLVRQFITGYGHVYIRFGYWADYRGRDT